MWESDFKEGLSPKNWCFQIVALEKILESPLDCKEMRQSILMEINSEYLLEGLMLKHWYFGHPMQRADLLEKILMLGKTEGKRRSRGRDGQTASLTQWTWIWANFVLLWRTEEPGGLQSMRSQRVGYDLATEQQVKHALEKLKTNSHHRLKRLKLS